MLTDLTVVIILQSLRVSHDHIVHIIYKRLDVNIISIKLGRKANKKRYLVFLPSFMEWLTRGADLGAWSVPMKSQEYWALKRKATVTCCFGEPRGNK